MDFSFPSTLSCNLNLVCMEIDHNHNNEKKQHHVSSYFSHGTVLVLLLFLTFLSVFVATINFGVLSVAVALIVASVKGTIVVSYFMHLKFENLFIRLMVIGVFLLFALVVLITFIDYFFR